MARRLREKDREENNVVDVRSGKDHGSGYYRRDQPIHSAKLKKRDYFVDAPNVIGDSIPYRMRDAQ